MNAVSVILTAALGAGGLGGAVALLRLRTDKDSTVVDTVSKSVLVLERLNDRLEKDLAATSHRCEVYAAELRRHGIPLPDP